MSKAGAANLTAPAFFSKAPGNSFFTMIKAALFDLDGLLIDTEPLWEEAEIQVFKKVGIELTSELCHKIKGFRVDESINYILRQFPIELNINVSDIENAILQRVSNLIEQKGKGMPGFVYILHFFKSRNIKTAVASSSKLVIIDAALNKLGINHHFESICSAEFEPYGKPHPGVFLTAAAKLGAQPEECIVFEDSLNGIIAAKAARMKAVLIPDKTLSGDKRVAIADLELKSLLNFKEDHLKLFEKQS